MHVRPASIKLKLDRKHVPIVVQIQIHWREERLLLHVLVMWATRVLTAKHVLLAWRENTRQLRGAVTVLVVLGIPIRRPQVTN